MAGLRRIIETLLASVTAIACLFYVTTCLAAEVSVVSSMPLKAPPIANYDWSGFYVGGHVGYSRGYGRNTLVDPAPTAASSSFGSLFSGLQFGYNYLLPSRLLVGIEGDISFPNYLDDGIVASRSTPSGAVTEKLDFVSTVRGRAGYAFDHWLFYVTGGLLAATGGPRRGRLEFREVLGSTWVMAAIHDFTPTLPWFIYKASQAVVHLVVMRSFGRHLGRLGAAGVPGPAAIARVAAGRIP